jgi:hypothetical protein
VALEAVRTGELALQESLHQGDPTARRLRLDGRQAKGRAVREAQAALDAAVRLGQEAGRVGGGRQVGDG